MKMMSQRLQKLITTSSLTVNAGCEKALSCKLARVERHLKVTEEAFGWVKEDYDDVPLLGQYQEQMGDIKKELSTIYEELVVVDLSDDHTLVTQHAGLEKIHFDCSHLIKKLLNSHSAKATATTSDKTSKLPKLDVPAFDGDVLHWQPFWEQFGTSIHKGCQMLRNQSTYSRPSIMDLLKLPLKVFPILETSMMKRFVV